MTKILLRFAIFLWSLPFLVLGGIFVGAQFDLLPIKNERDFYGTLILAAHLVDVCKVFIVIGLLYGTFWLGRRIGRQR
jgi:hypothetical protein